MEPLPESRFLSCDLTSDAEVSKALEEVRRSEGHRLASVIHLAAYYDFSGAPSDLYEELTVNGTRRILEGLSDFEVEQFVFASSMLVMKPSEDGHPIDECSPLKADWDYPKSKIEAEKVIEGYGASIPYVILRIAGVYDDRGHSIPIAQQVRRIYERKLKSYFFPGNAEHGQAFVHVDDLVECFRKVIVARDRLDPREVFLIGESDVMSYKDLQERIGVVLHGKEWPTIRIPAPVAKAGAWLQDKAPFVEDPFVKPWMVDLADANYPISIERAEEKLGWRPQRSLRNTLDMMLNRLTADPASWYEENDLPLPSEATRKTTISVPASNDER